LLAGAGVEFRRRRQTSLEPAFLDPIVFFGIVVWLFALPTPFPLAIAPVAVAVLTTRAAAPWSMGQCNLPCGSTVLEPSSSGLVGSNGVGKSALNDELFRRKLPQHEDLVSRLRQNLAEIVIAV
jgi:hypothetical protein